MSVQGSSERISGMKPGAFYNRKNNTCKFNIWAPAVEKLELKIVSPQKKLIPLNKDAFGWWQAEVEGIDPSSRYMYRINSEHDKPDPASFYQPEGVHEASAVIDHDEFDWSDSSYNPPELAKMIFYEAHVGTFTRPGTFAGAVERLDHLQKLGVNTLEIMPVAQFPGARNWGYDGAYLYAVQNSYGGPDGLKLLVNECHRRDISVCLDVVYNHLGPEGNYLSMYCPFFTDKYHTPWGAAVNYDDAYSYGVRDFVIANALYWFEKYHIDALRLDAIHGIFDTGAKHILREMAEAVEELSQKKNRRHYLIAESDLNDTRVISPQEQGGYGLPAQWSDDFHHALHTLLTGENRGYYRDFGQPDDLVKALNRGFVYDWDYSNYRKRMHGSSSANVPGDRLLVFIQNHDQVGNRMLGERLTTLVDYEALKLAAGVTLSAPYVPLLFMGEEFAEEKPFLYFVSHTDKNLIEAVREGRKREFKAFGWEQEPPDPQSEETFEKSRPDYTKINSGHNKAMFNFYRDLIKLRKENKCLENIAKKNCNAEKLANIPVIKVKRSAGKEMTIIIFNYSGEPAEFELQGKTTGLTKAIDSADENYGGQGSDLMDTLNSGDKLNLKAYQFVIYQQR